MGGWEINVKKRNLSLPQLTRKGAGGEKDARAGPKRKSNGKFSAGGETSVEKERKRGGVSYRKNGQTDG